MQQKQYARTKQVLETFKISHMTLWRWKQCPDFPQPLKRGQIQLFDLEAITQWLEVEA